VDLLLQSHLKKLKNGYLAATGYHRQLERTNDDGDGHEQQSPQENPCKTYFFISEISNISLHCNPKCILIIYLSIIKNIP
jgi:hypothetical protein